MILLPDLPIATSAWRPRKRLRNIERRLVRCFDDRASLTDTPGELQEAARDYGCCSRRLGLPPEQLVIALKRLVTSHGAPGIGLRVFEEPAPGASATTISGRLLAWCLDGYFAGASTRERA